MLQVVLRVMDKIFDIKLHNKLYDDEYYFISHYYFIENKLIILGWFNESATNNTHINYEINLENNNTFQTTNIPELIAWSIQSQVDRNLFVGEDGNGETFTVYSYKTGSEKTCYYPIFKEVIDTYV